MDEKNKLVYFGAIAFALFVMATQLFVVIQPGNRGVSVTLGKVDSRARGEGLSLKMPFIEQVRSVSIRQATVQGEATSFSKDLQTVTISFKALYKLPSNKVVELYQKYQGDPYRTLVEPRIQDAMKEVVAQYRAEDLVKNREKVRTETMVKVETALAGLVTLVDIPITNIDLSDELEHAIEMKQIKEQEALAKSYELDKAKKQAEITVVEAEAEAKAVKIKGQALRSAPEVIELEIAKKWDGKSPATVVVGKGGGNVLLPLR